MGDLGLEDARRLAGWRPELGVISLYLRFDPGDRGERWRTELHNGLERAVGAAAAADHDRKMAVRSTAQRLAERFNNGAVRPPPRGEAGFVEVSEKPAAERWWTSAVAPPLPAVVLAEQPLLAPLVGLLAMDEAVGIVLLSAERVRLLRCAGGGLEEIEEWELSITSRDWRERKARSTRDLAGAQGVTSSGHDQYEERLEHNRRRFLAECGRLVGERLAGERLARAVAFGPRVDYETFAGGIAGARSQVCLGGEDDLISVPAAQAATRVSAAVERIESEEEKALIERALAESLGGRRGSTGTQETLEALGEGRVEHLVLDLGIGEAAEALVRGAFAGDAGITVVRDGNAELLAPAEGVAAILRY